MILALSVLLTLFYILLHRVVSVLAVVPLVGERGQNLLGKVLAVLRDELLADPR